MVIQVWVDHGVKIFRVDPAHQTGRVLAVAHRRCRQDHPEVIWLAEAFTKPAMMHTLGKAGFQQSYTYYAWRNQKWGSRSTAAALRRRGDLYAPVLLADHARHPHAIHAVRRTDRVEAAGRPRRSSRPDIRDLCRVHELMESVARPGRRSRSTTRSTSTRTVGGATTSRAAQGRPDARPPT